MARNRVFYQSEALYVGPTPASGFHMSYGKRDDVYHGDPSLGLGHRGHMNSAPLGIADADMGGYEAGGGVLGGGSVAGGNLIPGSGYQSLVRRLHRIQDVSYSFNITRQDVNQFGELAAIDRVVLESPTVSLDFSYILANLENEHMLGFHVEQSGVAAGTDALTAMSGFLTKVTDERNYFIQTTPEGDDALGAAENALHLGNHDSAGRTSVIGIGNGFMTSYTQEASVGDFPTASVSIEGLNMSFDIGTSGNYIPAVNPENGQKLTAVEYALPSGVSHHTGVGTNDRLSALRPGDITFELTRAGGASINGALTGLMLSDAKIQSYSLSFDLARDPLQKLGSRYAFSREITFPVTVTCTVDANVGDIYSGNLADLIDDDSNINYDIAISLRGPLADSDTLPVARYDLRNCKIDSQEYSSDVGSNKSVSLTFSSQIGGTKQTTKGLFMSGIRGAGNVADVNYV
jgi:hypothetical protein